MSFTYKYPRPSLTVDVLAVTNETVPRILLIQRKLEPYAGRWAMPGGFVNENEPLDDAVRRELKEETGLELAGLQQLHTFGNPGRDPRGWTVSVVYWTIVNGDPPKLKPSDDAEDAAWLPLNAVSNLAFDHDQIIQFAKAQVLKK